MPAFMRVKHSESSPFPASQRLYLHYFGVNLDVVWQIAANELPNVAVQIEQIIGEL
jgi:hypothetical protein